MNKNSNTSKRSNAYPDLMLDIETMGDEPFSAILSIGAVEFDMNTGKIGKEFYQKISLESCISMGLKMTPSTVLWWMDKSEEARNEITDGKCVHIANALNSFTQFCNKDYNVWAKSPRFDCGLLKDAYTANSLPIPWDFKKERDVRTLISLDAHNETNFNCVGTAHNALDDCKTQVIYCTEIWKTLKTPTFFSADRS